MRTLLERAIFGMLILSALSFGQESVTTAQRLDCSKAKEALKKDGTNPHSTVKSLTALLANLQLACGTPEGYAAHNTQSREADTNPVGESKEADNIRKVASDCSLALIAFDKKIKNPDLSTDDLHTLSASVHHACGISGGPAESTTAAIAVRDDDQPTDSTQSDETQEAELQEIHQLVAENSTALNRDIALGNRLISHLKQAQTWEGVDSDHPDAVALREKIRQEEKELIAGVQDELAHPIDLERAHKECTDEEFSRWVGLVTETKGVIQDVNTQRDRYHALGY